MRGARLARLFWKDTELADRLEKDAADLKRRFNRDFWVSDGEYFALALDTEGNQVDALASNNGHLLWSGIVDKSKADAVVAAPDGTPALLGMGRPDLAEGEGRYNPIGYHVGTVWPFDNSFIAWGLRRYGFKEEAAQIAAGILDAAELFSGRLPEAFGGYERTVTKVSGAVPDRLQPAGLVDGHAALVAADDARTGAARGPSRGRPSASPRHRPSGAARHPGPLGTDRRLRTWPRGRRGATWREEVRCVASSEVETKGGQVSTAEAQKRQELCWVRNRCQRTCWSCSGITGDLAK